MEGKRYPVVQTLLEEAHHLCRVTSLSISSAGYVAPMYVVPCDVQVFACWVKQVLQPLTIDLHLRCSAIPGEQRFTEHVNSTGVVAGTTQRKWRLSCCCRSEVLRPAFRTPWERLRVHLELQAACTSFRSRFVHIYIISKRISACASALPDGS